MMDRDGLAARLIGEHNGKEKFRPFAAANGIASSTTPTPCRSAMSLC